MKERVTCDDDFIPNVVCKDLHWIKDYNHEERRLIVSYSARRAAKDKKLREKLIERTLKKSNDGKVKAADMIGNRGSKKFLKLRGEQLEIDQEKMLTETKWDGLHGVITNNTRLSSTESACPLPRALENRRCLQV